MPECPARKGGELYLFKTHDNGKICLQSLKR
jgi:hypothetical protein